jgi:hypothetical protein
MRVLPNWFPHHYTDVVDDDTGLIEARTDTGRFVTMKPGRYLASRFSHLDKKEITELATRLSATAKPSELKITETAEDAIQVYRNGPRSCMTNSDSVAVYSAPGDLRVAYIERFDTPTARAVVWPERKIHGRIYGDRIRLQTQLEKAGYTYGNFIGAKLPRIGRGKRQGFVLPYIDNMGVVEDCGDHILLGSGEFEAQSQNGFRPAKRCRLTGKFLPADHFKRVIQADGRAQYWHINHCRSHAYRCSYGDSTWYSNDVPKVELVNGGILPEFLFNQYGRTCAGNGKNYHYGSGRMVGDQWFSYEHLSTQERLAA